MLGTNEGSVRLIEPTGVSTAVDWTSDPGVGLADLPAGIGSRDADERLWDSFAKARRRFRGAIVAVSDRTMITNAAASELLQPADRRMLCRMMLTSAGKSSGSEVLFELANGLPVRARCHSVGWPGPQVGVVLHLCVAEVPMPDSTTMSAGESGCGEDAEPPVAATLDAALLAGWSELTDSERAVAELVGLGLSNREAGRRLFLSRHTVDYHLRRVFRKLGIKSRVELARVLGEHCESLSSVLADANAAWPIGRPLPTR